MGNTASDESNQSSPKNEKELLGVVGGNSSPDTKGGQLFVNQDILNQDALRNSLRQRGLCIGEGDLKDVLAKHKNLVE